MATFVHLTLDANLKAIRARGISTSHFRSGRYVFATPVGPDFQASHQWLRELRRRQSGRIAAVYFRVDDDTPVLAGRYNKVHTEMTAAEAVALFLADNEPGFEVLFNERIPAKGIFRTKILPQLVGWRFFPEAKGSAPFCCCDYCQKGQMNAQKLIRQWKQAGY